MKKLQKNEMFYEVRLAFNDKTQDIVIDANELPVALWGFVKNGKVVLKAGAFRGQDIISILPERVQTMGWNRGYKPLPDEWDEMNEVIGNQLESYQEDVKSLVFRSENMSQLIEQSKILQLPHERTTQLKLN